MNRSGICLAALALSGYVGGQAYANEYYTPITTAGSEVPVNISTVNATLAVKHSRVVHGLIISNSDVEAVTVTVSKLTDTTTTKTTGSGKTATTTTTTSASAAVTQAVIIVPASSTQVIHLPAGLPFSRSASNVADEMEVELTTTSSTPNVNLTIDYEDVAN
jgi:hypothetical protein